MNSRKSIMKSTMRLLHLALIACTMLCGATSRAAEPRPNIVVFLMDDMGIGDCLVYDKNCKVALPHIERLAKQGMVFSDAHTPAAVCAPTRYGVLTGNFPWRGRQPNGTWTIQSPSQIKPGQTTLGELLSRAGYATAFLGKEHLGGGLLEKATGKSVKGWNYDFKDIDFTKPMPEGLQTKGFGYVYSLPNGIQGKPFAFFENGILVGNPEELKIWKKGEYGYSKIGVDGYGAPDWDTSQAGPILTAKALKFLDDHFAHAKQSAERSPFLLYYSSESCHTPHSPPATLDGVPIKGASGHSDHLDMIFEADVTLGLLIERIRAAGELANTLFMFTSDNGGLSWGRRKEGDTGHRSSASLRGGKGQVWEGGHRVALIMKWGDGTADDSRIPPGSRSDALIGLQDLFATLAELTGQNLAAGEGLDSQSFLAALLGKPGAPTRETLLIQSNDENTDGQNWMRAFRKGPWKLIVSKELKPVHLYNLENDLEEKTNLINNPENAERVSSMLAELRAVLSSRRSVPLPGEKAQAQGVN